MSHPGTPQPIFFLINLFYFERERERERERTRAQVGEGQRERIPSRLHIVSAEPDAGLELMDREIMT